MIESGQASEKGPSKYRNSDRIQANAEKGFEQVPENPKS